MAMPHVVVSLLTLSFFALVGLWYRFTSLSTPSMSHSVEKKPSKTAA